MKIEGSQIVSAVQSLPLALPAGSGPPFSDILNSDAAAADISAATGMGNGAQLFSFNALGILGAGGCFAGDESASAASVASVMPFGPAATPGADIEVPDARASQPLSLGTPRAPSFEADNKASFAGIRSTPGQSLPGKVIVDVDSLSATVIDEPASFRFGEIEDGTAAMPAKGSAARLIRDLRSSSAPEPVNLTIVDIDGQLQITGAAPDLPEASRLEIRVIAETLADETGAKIRGFVLNGAPVHIQKQSGRSAS